MSNENVVIKLSREQTRFARTGLVKRQALTRALPEIIDAMMEKVLEDEDAVWEQLHELTGTNFETHNLTINWISGTLVAKPRDIITTTTTQYGPEVDDE